MSSTVGFLPTDDTIYERFEEQTGIRVNLIEGDSAALLERLTREGELSPADVFITVDAGRLYQAEQQEIFAPVQSDVLEERVPQSLRHPEGLWYGLTKPFSGSIDVDVLQALHGRAPSLATGAKRMRPDSLIFTLQGDGDMVNEGLQEVLHTAARGEAVTCVLLNNGVFGETGGHMTATTVIGQRTKNTIEGRDAAYHGHPILIGDLLAQLAGTAYAARSSVHNAAGVARTKRMLKKAFEVQLRGEGFSFVEVLTMCPTGWFIPTAEGPVLAGTMIIKSAGLLSKN